MTEIFEGRCDRLYRRHVTFEQQAEEAGKQDEKKNEEGDNGDDGRTEMKIPQVAVEERDFLNDERQRGVCVCLVKPQCVLKCDRGAVWRRWM